MMKLKQSYKYFTPVLLGVFMFASNFLNTNIFKFGDNNFAVWFVLSLLCFACGWYINRTLGWHSWWKSCFCDNSCCHFNKYCCNHILQGIFRK